MTLSSDEQDPMDEPVYVRALYDFKGEDESSLTFSKGEIIEVLTCLETGWWDGLLHKYPQEDERGWFPCNFVERISIDEARTEINISEDERTDSSYEDPVRYSTYDGSVQETSVAPPRSQPTNTNRISMTDDFWLPEVGTDGRIYFRNTKTGEVADELPTRDPSNPDYAPTVNTSDSSWNLSYRTQSEESLGSQTSATSTNASNAWVKRLADDGQSNYWYNTQTGMAQWEAPPNFNNAAHSVSERYSYAESEQDIQGLMALRTGFSNDYNGVSDLGADFLRRASAYMDDSEVRTLGDRAAHPPHFAPSITTQHVDLDLPSLEEIALRNVDELQAQLSPPEPEEIAQLSKAAREAINDITDTGRFLSSTTDSSSAKHSAQIVVDRVAYVVTAVRNVLYISGTLAAPTSSLTLQSPEAESARSARSPMNELKKLQRKVTSALAKLILSARAVKSHAEWYAPSTIERVEYDANELDRALVTLVEELQRASISSRKRLRGVFDTVKGPGGIGLSNMGGGFGGHSKALGFAPLAETSEKLTLSSELLLDVHEVRRKVDERLSVLDTLVRSSNQSQYPDPLKRSGELAVTELSILLGLIEDIDASTVMTAQNDRGSGHLALRRKARTAVRQLEVSKQAIFDDGMILLMICEGSDIFALRHIDGIPPSAGDLSSNIVHDIVTSLRSHIHGAVGAIAQLVECAAGQRQAAGTNGRVLRSRFDLADTSSVGSSRESSLVKDFAGNSINGHEDFLDMEVALRNTHPYGGVDSTLFGSEMSWATIVQEPSNGPHPSSERHTLGSTNGSVKTYTPRPSEDSSRGRQGPDAVGSDLDDSDDEDFYPSKPKSPPRTNSSKVAKVLGLEIGGSQPVAKPSKVAQVLGNEAPQPVEPVKVPWYMVSKLGPDDIKYKDGTVRAGTLPAFVERLTLHDNRDVTFNDTFIMTFKSFATEDEVLDLLITRFHTPPPEGMNDEERQDWTTTFQDPVRIRVMNAIKSIVQEHELAPADEKDPFIERVSAFAISIQPTYPPAKIILDAANNSKGSRKLVLNAPQSAPTPLVPKISASRGLKLLDIDPLELARQLTIREAELFSKIQSMECLARAKDSQGNDNISRIITMSNKIADWVNNAVLSRDDPRKRASVIKHFIHTAKRCRELNNFSTMAALIAALNSPPIRRLKRTWDQVNKNMIETLDDVEKTVQTGKNLAEYRQMLASFSLPCVPFIGVYLTTLTFVQDGMKDNLVKEGNLINFSKRLKAAEIIKEIHHYQSQPYNLNVVESIRTFIEGALSIDIPSEDFWKQSLVLEPREREDEKMARLLQESGFL